MTLPGMHTRVRCGTQRTRGTSAASATAYGLPLSRDSSVASSSECFCTPKQRQFKHKETASLQQTLEHGRNVLS